MELNPYFYEMFHGMERMCPGGPGTRRKMMKAIPSEREINILDVGCGQGQGSIALAEAFPKARIIAIDTNQDYIRQLNQQAMARGLAQQLQGMVMSMDALTFPHAQFDVIWAEGSIYIMGFEEALEDWKKFLRPEGLILCNDLCWKESLVSKRYKTEITEVFGELDFYKHRGQMAKDKGYIQKDLFLQPHSDWAEGYYLPLSRRLEEMKEKYPPTEEFAQAQEAMAQLEREIDLFRNYAPFYAYVYFVLQLASS